MFFLGLLGVIGVIMYATITGGNPAAFIDLPSLKEGEPDITFRLRLSNQYVLSVQNERIHDPRSQICYQIITWEVAIPVYSVYLKSWRDYSMVIGVDSLNYAPVTFWRPDLKIDCVWGLRTSREISIF